MVESRRVQKVFSKPSRTQQSFKNECDINVILTRFKKNCGVEFLNCYQGYLGGQFGDFSNVSDFQAAQNQVRKAEEVFMSMPAKARAYFQNSCKLFLDALADQKRISELQDAGILTQNVVVPEAKAEG